MRLLVVLLIGIFTTGCGVMGSFKVAFQDKKGNTYETKVDLTPSEKGLGFKFISKDGQEYACSYANKKVINGEDDVVELICLLPEKE